MGNSIEKPQQTEASPEDLHTQQNPTCEICIEPILSPNKLFNNRNLCSHPYCENCIIKYIQVKLEDNLAKIPCPALHCTHFLDSLSCRTILPPQLFVKWCDVLCNAFVLGLDGCYCPNRDCSVLVINECGGGGKLKKSKCPNCKKLFCFKCKLPWHAGFRCEDSSELIEPDDVAFGVLAERNKWMRCPRCRLFVQRVEGCKIMKCRCYANFCYSCGKEVNQHWCSCDTTSMICMVFFRIITLILLVVAIVLFFLIVVKVKSYLYRS